VCCSVLQHGQVCCSPLHRHILQQGCISGHFNVYVRVCARMHSRTRRLHYQIFPRTARLEHQNVQISKCTYPFTREIRLQIFGSRDLPVFLIDLLSDGDSVYTRENLYENLGTPVKMCWICMGTPAKTCQNFGIRNYLKSGLLRLWSLSKETYILSKETYNPSHETYAIFIFKNTYSTKRDLYHIKRDPYSIKRDL